MYKISKREKSKNKEEQEEIRRISKEEKNAEDRMVKESREIQKQTEISAKNLRYLLPMELLQSIGLCRR